MCEKVRFYAEMPILGLERCDIFENPKKLARLWRADVLAFGNAVASLLLLTKSDTKIRQNNGTVGGSVPLAKETIAYCYTKYDSNQ